MTNKHNVEYTDTFAGEANYSWVNRKTVIMPELTHYGYDGSSNYVKANKVYNRELVKRAKAAVGLTGVRGKGYWHGDEFEFRPYGSATVMFITFDDEHADDKAEREEMEECQRKAELNGWRYVVSRMTGNPTFQHSHYGIVMADNWKDLCEQYVFGNEEDSE